MESSCLLFSTWFSISTLKLYKKVCIYRKRQNELNYVEAQIESNYEAVNVKFPCYRC